MGNQLYITWLNGPKVMALKSPPHEDEDEDEDEDSIDPDFENEVIDAFMEFHLAEK